MKPIPNQSAGGAPRRVERRMIEDVWKFERILMAPLLPRQAVAPAPALDEPEAPNRQHTLVHDLADIAAEETLGELDMGDIDQEAIMGLSLSKQQFIAIVLVLTVTAMVVAYMATFIEIKSLARDIVQRLY